MTSKEKYLEVDDLKTKKINKSRKNILNENVVDNKKIENIGEDNIVIKEPKSKSKLTKEVAKQSSVYNLNGFLNNFGYCINKDKLPVKIANMLRLYFKVTPKTNYDEDLSEKEIEEKSFEVFFEDDNYIVLPKFAPNIQLNLKNPIEIDSNSYNKITFLINKYGYKKTSCNFNFTGNLRDVQKLIIKTSLEKMGLNTENPTNHSDNKVCKGGLLKLGCGIGKTIMAIYLSHLLKLKTLVIVHKEFLQDQWVERFKQFTNAKVGTIRQNKVDVENKDVVIGMLQSIAMKDYDEEIFNKFGLVIYDEVHHVASKVYSQALMKTSAEYTIGLSATPERSDGLGKVINWHIGNVLYQMEKKIDYKVLVKKVFFRSDNPVFREKKRWFQGRMAPDNTAMIDILSNIESRNQLIINITNTLKNIGRKILILSYRVEHLEYLKAAIDKKIIDDGEAHIYNSYFYMGKTKKGERRMAEKDGDIIFATMQLAEEGLDIPHLDTIIFALPVSIKKEKETKKKYDKTLIQSIGRILRNDKLEELTQIPLVVDISDILSIYQNWSKKRDDVYDKKNWYLQHYYWTDNTYIFGSDEDVKKEPMKLMFDDILDEEFIEKNLLYPEDKIVKDDTNEITDKDNKSDEEVEL